MAHSELSDCLSLAFPAPLHEIKGYLDFQGFHPLQTHLLLGVGVGCLMAEGGSQSGCGRQEGKGREGGGMEI